jgi:hypothetical protein
MSVTQEEPIVGKWADTVEVSMKQRERTYLVLGRKTVDPKKVCGAWVDGQAIRRNIQPKLINSYDVVMKEKL